jgi:hypothetical protein
MDGVEMQRAIARCTASACSGSSSSFSVGRSNLPAGFATFAAYGDFAAGVLAMLALLTIECVRSFGCSWSPSISWGGRHHLHLLSGQPGRPSGVAGELGATYAIRIIYVPALMITHFVAFYLLVRPKREVARALADDAALWIGLAMRQGSRSTHCSAGAALGARLQR